MKIDSHIQMYDAAQHAKTNRAQGTGAAEGQLPGGARTAERESVSTDPVIHFSEASRTAHVARQAITAAPDVRTERVTVLKEAIASGAYRVDQAAVADKLVDTLLGI